MAIDRVAASTMTLYSEALEQALLVERLLEGVASLPGSLTAKEIRGRTYLYWQVAVGGSKKQHYLGPDSPELRAVVDRAQAQRSSVTEDLTRLERMAAMLSTGGLFAESSAVGTVIDLFAGLGFFRRGALLVGTQAFRATANLLGFRPLDSHGMTQDIDLAHDLEIATVSAESSTARLETERSSVVEELGKLDFLPVPELEPGQASVSYKVRGKELRVDFLTSQRGIGRSRPVAVPGLGIHAQPLPLLDYLLGGEAVPALVLWKRATLVRLPDPSRFALHKLWTAAHRPTSQSAKAKKDRRQAEALLEVLAEDRPASLRSAWEALEGRAGKTAIRNELKRLSEGPRTRLGWG